MPYIEVIYGQLAVNDRKETETWVSPLEIGFSQNVIYPRFTDGRSVDSTVHEITAEAVEDEVRLLAPFPTIHAIRWSPKLRDGKGKPLLNKKGETMYGTESLFTLDNRRLYALQRAAVLQHPRHCTACVRVVTDRAEALRHIKKFRTRTNGLSITISEWNGVGRNNADGFSALRLWDWRSVVAHAMTVPADSEALLAEAAMESGSCGSWEYIDSKGVRQGPFSNWQMRQWWERKWLPPDLRIRPYSVEQAVRHNKNRTCESQGEEGDETDFVPVNQVFDPSDCFAAGSSPRFGKGEATWQACAHCQRNRWEGWGSNGRWYCITCWAKWKSGKA